MSRPDELPPDVYAAMTATAVEAASLEELEFCQHDRELVIYNRATKQVMRVAPPDRPLAIQLENVHALTDFVLAYRSMMKAPVLLVSIENQKAQLRFDRSVTADGAFLKLDTTAAWNALNDAIRKLHRQEDLIELLTVTLDGTLNPQDKEKINAIRKVRWQETHDEHGDVAETSHGFGASVARKVEGLDDLLATDQKLTFTLRVFEDPSVADLPMSITVRIRAMLAQRKFALEVPAVERQAFLDGAARDINGQIAEALRQAYEAFKATPLEGVSDPFIPMIAARLIDD